MGFVQGSNALAAGKIKLGSTDIDKIYFGSTEAWPATAPTGYLYLQPNGVTISAYPSAVTGQSYSFLGQTYTVVDNAGLTAAKTNGDDLSLVVTTRVTNIQISGYDAIFNDNIGSWDVSNVTNMNGLFNSLVAFNQDISYWDVSNVTFMENTFLNAYAFNQPLNSWDVSNVTSFGNMFLNARAFNQPLNSWDITAANNIISMFAGAYAFNQNINVWNTLSITSMANMFNNAQSFNQPLNSWNVSNVTDMSGMLRLSPFNQDISMWDVGNVSSMNYMFENNTAFNKDLSGWCVLLIPSAPTNFSNGASSWVLPKPVWGTCP